MLESSLKYINKLVIYTKYYTLPYLYLDIFRFLFLSNTKTFASDMSIVRREKTSLLHTPQANEAWRRSRIRWWDALSLRARTFPPYPTIRCKKRRIGSIIYRRKYWVTTPRKICFRNISIVLLLPPNFLLRTVRFAIAINRSKKLFIKIFFPCASTTETIPLGQYRNRIDQIEVVCLTPHNISFIILESVSAIKFHII